MFLKRDIPESSNLAQMITMLTNNNLVHNLTLRILIWRHYDFIIPEPTLYTMENA